MSPLTDVSPVRRNFFCSADSVDSLVTGATLGDEICFTKKTPDEDLMVAECRLDDANADGLDSDVEGSLADDLDALYLRRFLMSIVPRLKTMCKTTMIVSLKDAPTAGNLL
jgi:hypothetical protein